jgi:transposase
MNIKVVGIDLAKHYFQVCVLTDQDEIHSNKKVTRARLLDVLRQFPEGTLIAMEACSTSNYWARTFAKMGFKIKLIPPQHVKPFVGHQKNDANDARAICEAASGPSLHNVPTKTVELQDIKSIRCIRQRRFKQRLAAANQLKGLASEYGVVIAKSCKCLREQVLIALENADNELSLVMRRMIY